MSTPEWKDVLELQQRYSHLPDPTATLFSLAIAVSGQMTGMPLWGMHVGAPSAGKSESVGIVADIADARTSEITAAGLLSMTRAGKNAKPTGLLTRIGPRGFVTINDMSPVIAGSDRGATDKLFGLLREAYDGRVARDLGQEIIQLLWTGRLTLLAAVTTDIDRFASHADALGPRWLYYRHTQLDAESRRAAMQMAGGDRDERQRLRAEAHEMAALVVSDATHRLGIELPTSAHEKAITDVAEVVALGRATVPRTGYGQREIVGEAVREEPMRLVEQLNALYTALIALRVDVSTALRVVHVVGLDSMPLTRRKVLGQLAGREQLTAAEISRRVRTDRKVVAHALEDFHVLGAARYIGDENDHDDASRSVRLFRLEGDETDSIVRAFSRDTKARGPKSGALAGGGTKRGRTPHIPPVMGGKNSPSEPSPVCSSPFSSHVEPTADGRTDAELQALIDAEQPTGNGHMEGQEDATLAAIEEQLDATEVEPER